MSYWKLSKQLIDDSIDVYIVNFFATWYSNQQACVLWKVVISRKFYIGNGTIQGELLFPYLYTRYVHSILTLVNSCRIGCNIGGACWHTMMI